MPQRKTIADIKSRKGRDPLVCLTAYTKPFAQLLDPHVDILLVGDSVGMVLYGMDSTLEVTLGIMKAHGKAVVKHSSQALVVVDMPFGSYQASPAEAFKHAAALMRHTGCQAVKLEGGVEMAETVRFLTERGIPVMGHVGLMPQHVHMLSGYKFQGRTPEQAEKITADAASLEEAGAFSIVLEGVDSLLAEKVTSILGIPTIGIGASPACDGQVLVIDDVLGLFPEFTPRFAKRYADVGKAISEAVMRYTEEVKTRRFPAKEHCFFAKK